MGVLFGSWREMWILCILGEQLLQLAPPILSLMRWGRGEKVVRQNARLGGLRALIASIIAILKKHPATSPAADRVQAKSASLTDSEFGWTRGTFSNYIHIIKR